MANNLLERTDFNIKEYKKYGSYDEYQYARDYPEKYSVISQITAYDKYLKYKDEITEIRNNTSNDKEETISYINSLNLSIPQKAIFIKQYYKSFTQYDRQIIEYINSKSYTRQEKETILTNMGFTIIMEGWCINMIANQSRAITSEDILKLINIKDIKDVKKFKQDINTLKEQSGSTQTLLNNFIIATTDDLQELHNQVDGNITTWFLSGVPTLSNKPAVDWIDDIEK